MANWDWPLRRRNGHKLPKPAKGSRLGSNPAHQKLLLSGLAAALIREERIRTTQAKAMRLRAVADRLVTWGKSGSLSDRRRALSLVHDRDVVHKLFAEISPRYSERNGGYTRVLKLGPRQGDAAPMAIIEFVEGEAPEATKESAPEKRRRGIRRRGKGASAAAPAAPASDAATLAPRTDNSPTHVPPDASGLVESPAPSASAAPPDVTETPTETETPTRSPDQTDKEA